MAKGKIHHIVPTITHTDVEVRFDHVPIDLVAHEAWLKTHGMIASAKLEVEGELLLLTGRKETKATGKISRVTLTFDTAAHAKEAFELIQAEGECGADDWDDETRYYGDTTRAVTKEFSDALVCDDGTCDPPKPAKGAAKAAPKLTKPTRAK